MTIRSKQRRAIRGRRWTGTLGAAALALAAGRVALELGARRRRAMPLRGATAIVCGASRGLGRAIAFELARRGVAKLGICARSERDLNEVAAELVHHGVHVCAEVCDLSSEEDTERFMGSACARLGPIDVLVTNAGAITVGPSETLTKEDFDEALESLFYSALNPILCAMPAMRYRRKGTIALVTSIGARVGVPHLAPYCAAKFATMGLAESLRAELAADGVHVLSVVPGLMRTGSHVRVEVKGDHELEYAWFGAAATFPIFSMDADRAARRIVSAIARGAVEVSFTPEARLAPIARALAPTLWSDVLALAARLLPRPRDEFPRATERRGGLDIEVTSGSRAVAAVRMRGRKFAERHAQLP